MSGVVSQLQFDWQRWEAQTGFRPVKKYIYIHEFLMNGFAQMCFFKIGYLGRSWRGVEEMSKNSRTSDFVYNLLSHMWGLHTDYWQHESWQTPPYAAFAFPTLEAEVQENVCLHYFALCSINFFSFPCFESDKSVTELRGNVVKMASQKQYRQHKQAEANY